MSHRASIKPSTQQVTLLTELPLLSYKNKQTNTVAAEHSSSTLLIPQPATGHDPEPVPFTSDPPNPSLYTPS
jgi:hypothetical protein